MMAHGSGQNSETERFQTGLNICLYTAKPEAQGSQNTPLQSQIIVQSLTVSRLYRTTEVRQVSVPAHSLCVTVTLQKPHLHCFKVRKEVIRINESFKSWHSGCFSSGNVVLIYMYVIYTCTEILCFSTLDSHNLSQHFHWKLKYYSIIIL